MSESGKIEGVIATAFVQSWDQHIGQDGAIAVLNQLDAKGYKIVQKDETEQMLERVQSSTAAQRHLP